MPVTIVPSEYLLPGSIDEVRDHVADITALVDGVGDDDTVVVASQFQAEPGFRFFRILLGRRRSFRFHTAEEQNFSGVKPTGCDENVTKGFWRQAKSPEVLGTKGLCMAGAAGLEPVTSAVTGQGRNRRISHANR